MLKMQSENNYISTMIKNTKHNSIMLSSIIHHLGMNLLPSIDLTKIFNSHIVR